jgi:hypothetical protein
MSSEEEIAKLQEEQEEARQDLRDTLNEVNAKIEQVESDLRPDHLIESHPVGASIVAGALGFLLGARLKSRLTGPIMIAALIGIAFSQRTSKEGSEPDGGEAPSDE